MMTAVPRSKRGGRATWVWQTVLSRVQGPWRRWAGWLSEPLAA